MDGWIEGWMDGVREKGKNGWLDGERDGWMDYR